MGYNLFPALEGLGEKQTGWLDGLPVCQYEMIESKHDECPPASILKMCIYFFTILVGAEHPQQTKSKLVSKVGMDGCETLRMQWTEIWTSNLSLRSNVSYVSCTEVNCELMGSSPSYSLLPNPVNHNFESEIGLHRPGLGCGKFGKPNEQNYNWHIFLYQHLYAAQISCLLE